MACPLAAHGRATFPRKLPAALTLSFAAFFPSPVPAQQLPLDLVLHDAQAAPLRLADALAGGQPVLLLPGYARCERLCGVAFQNLLQALAAGSSADGPRQLLRLSLDPAEDPAAAQAREQAERAQAQSVLPPSAPAPRWLLADAPALRTLAAAVPALQAARADDGSLAHPVAALVLTPQGRVAAELPGVDFDPAALRLALQRVAQGRDTRLLDRLAYRCMPALGAAGRASAVLQALRWTLPALLLALGGGIAALVAKGRRRP